MRVGVALAAWLLLTAATAPAQPAATRDPRPFRSEIEAVEIDVRVVDAAGSPVAGLSRDDFELFEDGVRQHVKTFAEFDVPFHARPAGPAAEPDVETNRHPLDGRLYLIVLDDLHVHPHRAARVKHAVRRFLEEHFAAKDRAALVVTSGRTEASQELTRSRQALLAALEQFQGRKLRSSTLERLDRYYLIRDTLNRDEPNHRGQTKVLDPLDFERGYTARTALETLAGAARWLANVPARRKALLFVSEGIDYDIHDVFESRDAGGIMVSTREAIGAAARSNVSIYAIDPRGLTALGAEQIEMAGLPEDTSLGLGPGSLQREIELGQNSLRTLATETGGFAIVNDSELASAFGRIVSENSRYYVLGYEPSNRKRDGRFRRVEVRVKRPGVRVAARPGYVAPGKDDSRKAEASEGSAPELRPLLDSPIPVAGLPLDSDVAIFRGANDKASALLTLEIGPALTFTESGGQHHGRVDIGMMAIASDGRIAARDDRGIELKLKPETYAHVRRHGFRTLSRLELPPGRYQLRIAAREPRSGQAGSVVHDIVVPDYATPPLAVSDVVLGSRGAAQALTTRPDPLLKDRLLVPPTGSRVFEVGEVVTVLAEVYDNRTDALEAVEVQTTMTDARGMVAVRVAETVERFSFDPARRVWTHRVNIPLKDVAAGEYVLRVEAKVRGGTSPAISRELPIRVANGLMSATTH